MVLANQNVLPQCRGCGLNLDAERDSEAHIIPKALGGRLKPKGIICKSCNTKLNDLADNALIEAFADWPTVLDIPREGGGNPPKLIETKNGRRVRMQADGSMIAVDVIYEGEYLGQKAECYVYAASAR